MLILPDKSINKARYIIPVLRNEPDKNLKIRFRARAKTHDGVVLWTGWFYDPDEFDAFIFATVNGNLHNDKGLWRLPVPEWPDLPEGLLYDFASVSFTTYTTTGNQNVTVPDGTLGAVIKAWGAGGSGGGTDTPYILAGGAGGGCGFAGAQISATPGSTLVVRVGAGGQGGADTTSAGAGGAGGGYSGVFASTVTFANARVIAAGGAGGGAGATGGAGGRGGAGGASTGETGVNGGGDQGDPGTGGTQSAGGTAQGLSSYIGTDGSALKGGEGGSSSATNNTDTTSGPGGSQTSACGGGGGGGGGYYGGGGGARGGGSDGGGGGGGGSNYVSGTDTTSTQGSSSTAANNTDTDYVAGKGNGGAGSTGSDGASGQNGVVLMGFIYPMTGFNMPMLGM